MEISIWFWFFFNLIVVALLSLDLLVFHRKPHLVTIKEASFWSAFWIVLSLLFGMWIWHYLSPQKGLEFFTGYVIEKSLSIDNIFLFIVIFKYFGIRAEWQHRLLFWGVIGALIMRGAMIAIGVTLVSEFHWILYIFGIFLIYTGFKLLVQKKQSYNPEKNPIVKLARRYLPFTENFENAHFIVKKGKQWFLTPLFLCLLVVESVDVIFALDSIPAIFAITQDSFIIYTSNVGAILGLRSLYFLLANLIPKFIYLQHGISIILIFVGCKMLIVNFYKIPTWISLLFIASVITISTLVSLCKNKKPKF